MSNDAPEMSEQEIRQIVVEGIRECRQMMWFGDVDKDRDFLEKESLASHSLSHGCAEQR